MGCKNVAYTVPPDEKAAIFGGATDGKNAVYLLLGGLASRLPELIEAGERSVIRLPIGSDQAAHE
jgi:hypothetical protein